MRITSWEERAMACSLAQMGHSDRQIAQLLGWKEGTVRKWRRRGQKGLQGLTTRMGRPATGAMGTFRPEVCATLRRWRTAHPGWGPRTLRYELAKAPPCAELPSRATIARWLKQQKLTRAYARHQELPTPTPASAQSPHQEWEMDARGQAKVPSVGVVTLIDLNDRFSKLKLMSYPCWLGQQRASRHATTEDYQGVFRLTASDWGLPDRLYVDRDSVYFDNNSKSPFPTRLHCWLLALGVELVVGRPDRPTDRGMCERNHQTWAAQVVEGQVFPTWEALYLALRQRRDVLNAELPCASTQDQPPLVAHPEARYPRRLYRPEWEAQLMDLSRLDAYLRRGRWFRKASNVGAVSLGDQTYVLGKKWIKKDVEITFDPSDRYLVFHAPQDNLQTRKPIKGLSKPELMGELGPLVSLHNFQLALPFTWEEWRALRLCETLVDTT